MNLKDFCLVDSTTGDYTPADTSYLLNLNKLNDTESLDFAEGESWDRIHFAKKYGVDLETLEYHEVMQEHQNFHMSDDDVRELLIFIHQHADSDSSVWNIAQNLRAHLNSTHD